MHLLSKVRLRPLTGPTWSTSLRFTAWRACRAPPPTSASSATRWAAASGGSVVSTATEAEAVGASVLGGNAKRLYRL